MAQKWNRWVAAILVTFLANSALAQDGEVVEKGAEAAQKGAAVQAEAVQKGAVVQKGEAVQKGAVVQKGEAVQKGAVVAGPAIQYVTRTVLRPTYVTEKRMVTEVQYKSEQKTRMVQVCRQVPETSQVEQPYVEIVRHPKSRVETYQVCVPVYETMQQQYQVRTPVYSNVERVYQVRVPVYRDEVRDVAVLVPHTEMHKGVRNVTKMVPVNVMKTVCRDAGHWETRVSTVCVTPVHGCRRHCGACVACCTPPVQVTRCHRVWVPNIVQEQVPCTTYQCQVEQVPYNYPVCVMKKEIRQQTIRVCDYEVQEKKRMERVCNYKVETKSRPVQVCRNEIQTKQRTVNYVECVPVTKKRMVNVTTYKTVVDTREEKYMVHTPVHVQKEIDVTVCKLVPHQETVAVSCAPVHCGCSIGCRHHRTLAYRYGY